MGICVLSETENGLAAEFHRSKTTLSAIRFLDSFCTLSMYESTFFCVENSNLQSTTFAKYVAGNNPAQLMRISRNVGANQAVSQLIVDLLHDRNMDVLEVSPERKGKKWTKEQAESVAKQYAIELPRTSQDDRDAFKLAIILYEKKIKEKA
jgi:hypothetical protein